MHVVGRAIHIGTGGLAWPWIDIHPAIFGSLRHRLDVILPERFGPTWQERLLGVLHMLREHILKEQDGVFPAALAVLEPDQWERIEAVRAQFESAPTTLTTATLAASERDRA